MSVRGTGWGLRRRFEAVRKGGCSEDGAAGELELSTGSYLGSDQGKRAWALGNWIAVKDGRRGREGGSLVEPRVA
ncbi:hypothetical protein M0R45_007171 [Rubus argutus]|uniref:Uncharacterized protein n=1 Tax=Rubus argutus TaxID=59490 RepID=A0AAW1YSQ1_RUBAR